MTILFVLFCLCFFSLKQGLIVCYVFTHYVAQKLSFEKVGPQKKKKIAMNIFLMGLKKKKKKNTILV